MRMINEDPSCPHPQPSAKTDDQTNDLKVIKQLIKEVSTAKEKQQI